MSMRYQGKTVWIIGASSGIGEALAHHVASQGARVILSARQENKLLALRSTMDAKKDQQHLTVPLDVADLGHVQCAFERFQQEKIVLDHVIFLAALYDPMPLSALDLEKTRQLFDVNVMGAFYLLHFLLPFLKAQGHGQIALCGSVAGYVGLPNGQPYSASKAAIMSIAQSLRSEASPELDVKLISPGFVKTPLTDKNSFDMPMIIAPEQAAMAIADGLLEKPFEIHFPKRFTVLMKILAALPYTLYFALAKKMATKN